LFRIGGTAWLNRLRSQLDCGEVSNFFLDVR
jgi:hypothetical protein